MEYLANEVDQKAVNAAVKIKISLDRRLDKYQPNCKEKDKIRSLTNDLARLISNMNFEAYNQYLQRIR